MFKMTTEQLLSAPMGEKAFVDWYVEEFMRSELAQFYIDLGPRICATFTRTGRLYAKHFGLQRPDLQAQFITLMWVLAPNFWEDLEFRAILGNPALGEVEKVDGLYAASEEAAQRAMANTDSEAWYPELREDNILGVPYIGISDDEVDDLLDEIRRKRN